MGRGSGAIDEADLRALAGGDDAALASFGELERDVLALADAMTATPQVVCALRVERLRVALGEAALVALTALIAWENHRARFNHALGVEAEGYDEGAVCLAPLPA